MIKKTSNKYSSVWTLLILVINTLIKIVKQTIGYKTMRINIVSVIILIFLILTKSAR